MTEKKKTQRGQGLLESVLVTLAFLMVTIGTIDMGQVLFVHQSLVERVRAALRYGATHPFDATTLENMVLYNQPTVPTTSTPTGSNGSAEPTGFLGLTRSMVTVTRHDATLNEDRIAISIEGYPYQFFTPFISGVYAGKPIRGSTPYEVL